jgi:hypothetical protein
MRENVKCPVDEKDLDPDFETVGVYVLLTVRTSEEVVDFVEKADHEDVLVLIRDSWLVTENEGDDDGVLDGASVLEFVIEIGIVLETTKEPVPVVDTVEVFDCGIVFVPVVETEELFDTETEGDIV